MSASVMPAPQGDLGRPESNLTRQLEHIDGERTPKSTKTRSLSDAPKPSLSPSPAFREPGRRVSKDDCAVAQPTTPKRAPHHLRGLSLQMPPKDSDFTYLSSSAKVPSSPKLDSSHGYGSPASMLPRRSRGLDFARACTHLHHSTLAESSPDASPITGRGIQIPQRRSLGNQTVLGSPGNSSYANWSMPGDRTTLSSSISSINMMDSDSDSDDSSEDMIIDREMDDPVLNTPAASRLNGIVLTNSPGMDWLTQQPNLVQANPSNYSPNPMSFRRARLRKGKSSHSSSSVSMRSSKPSPGPLSPPIRQSVENGGYFGLNKQQVRSRRESLSLGTDHLHLSDSEDGETKINGGSSNDASSERGVIRRAVTRRSNLLPKTKGFARIRAQLLEESDPLHSEARREAEVIKQVQESDPDFGLTSNILDPNTALVTEPLQTSIEINTPGQIDTQSTVSSAEPFSQHAERNSGGLGFWNTFDERYRTPPPPTVRPQESSSGMSDDTLETMATSADNPILRHLHRSRSRSLTPLASNQSGNHPPTAGDVARKVNNKRRRDDDFDPNSFKRRAVSPGMSAQSSPVIPQSPVLNGNGGDRSWGRPPAKTNGDRNNSAGSNGTATPNAGGGIKRVGLTGMNEASEGFMSMSID